jgi:hypothetical protein
LDDHGGAHSGDHTHSASAASFAAISYFACEQLANYESKTGDLQVAVDDYNTALSWINPIEYNTGVRPEVL